MTGLPERYHVLMGATTAATAFPVHPTPAPLAPADILARQRAAFQREGPPAAARRRSDLQRLRTAILANRDACAAAVSADFGHRSAHETVIMELLTLVHGIGYLRRQVRAWMRPQRRHVPLHFQPA
ncbi:MAG TPA: hypothetical protein VMB48_13725, partial [Steroidobacteraceae bacterium]|nr:hypothetical protein [Steroidobacteraceae bacterium]